MANGGTTALIRKDMAGTPAVGVSSVPAVFVNGMMMSGRRNMKQHLLPAAFFALVMSVGAATSGHVVESFDRPSAGENPYGPLASDGKGNFFGTTYNGGLNIAPCGPCGVVFKLSPAGSGYSYTVVYRFHGNDGANPLGALAVDSSGNVYSTTSDGGNDNSGTVFELSPEPGGGWTETVLYAFTGNVRGSTDGFYPRDGIIRDSAGNLFGVTYFGGTTANSGTAYEITQTSAGVWTETVLYNFTGQNGDGATPNGRLLPDAAGNLYGTTFGGGASGCGTVFELSPTAGGTWTEKVLHSFDCAYEGSRPSGGLSFDSVGNLYGTTQLGGINGGGTVFQLFPASPTWTINVVHQFGGPADVSASVSGVVIDNAGNLYGTGSGGGAHLAGGVFKLSPDMGGGWTETALHIFTGGADGGEPQGLLTFGIDGNLYGTTPFGGNTGFGVVFQAKP
jgi:uncharacterized repeat protein (TIGR03803 family)